MPSNPFADRQLWRLPAHSAQPLYRQILALVVGHVHSGRLKPGEVLPSYPSLARTLGVADRTVRHAYAQLEQSGVLVIRRGKGTFVAGPGAPREAALLGVLRPPLPWPLAAASWIWAVMRGICEAADEARLVTLAFPAGQDQPGAWGQWGQRVGGVIVVLAEEASGPHAAALTCPSVRAGRASGRSELDSVDLDYEGAARELTYRIIGAGHEAIGLLRPAHTARGEAHEAGYRHALGAASLPVDPGWVAKVDADLGEMGLSAADDLLTRGVTAVVACEDGLARMAAEAASRRGLKTPEQLSLAALVAAAPAPLPGGGKLEAVQLDPAEVGRRCVRRLAQLQAAPGAPPRQEVLEGRRIEGDTVAPPRTKGA
jgi:DNA-binding LacI/PurR family transcriptional regulator